jgi:hypothetical protein
MNEFYMIFITKSWDAKFVMYNISSSKKVHSKKKNQLFYRKRHFNQVSPINFLNQVTLKENWVFPTCPMRLFFVQGD